MGAFNKTHSLGTRARILLTSVFGPYAQDDAYGSRKTNPMELYHNQVTREQGGFSLRMFHRSFGLKMIQENIEAPCWLLDFPTLERFKAVLSANAYDIIGIGAIVPNVDKVKKMCALIRAYQPQAEIVIGGHIAGLEDLADRIDADHIVKGDGIRWFRRYLGQDPAQRITHPLVYSAFDSRILGVRLSQKKGETAAILIPSVGCPLGCNFCSTSAFFGGKGKFINFFETGEALFQEMCRIEKALQVRSFFVLDENFLLHRQRALKLLDLMKENHKSWSLNVFSSARVIQSYTLSQLVELGIAWVWMGLEGRSAAYPKLNGIDTYQLVKELQANGIRVMGSTIIGLEDHTPANMDQVIEDAIQYGTDFHQFMLYTPNPGTPLHASYRKKGRLLPETEMDLADTHGQYRFNYRHPHIPASAETTYLLKAFKRDFSVNGPSLVRLIRTHLNGWQRHKLHPAKRVRDRYDWEVNPLRSTWAGAVWAMMKWYRADTVLRPQIERLLKDIYEEFGMKTRIIAPIVGRYALLQLSREERLLQKGRTYEPQTFFEANAAARSLQHKESRKPVKRLLTAYRQQWAPLSQALINFFLK